MDCLGEICTQDFSMPHVCALQDMRTLLPESIVCLANHQFTPASAGRSGSASIVWHSTSSEPPGDGGRRDLPAKRAALLGVLQWSHLPQPRTKSRQSPAVSASLSDPCLRRIYSCNQLPATRCRKRPPKSIDAMYIPRRRAYEPMSRSFWSAWSVYRDIPSQLDYQSTS